MKKIFGVIFILAAIFGGFLALDFAFPLNLNALHRPQSQILTDRNGEIIALRLSDDGFWRLKTDEIPEILKASVLHFEDRYFYHHFGVNFASILRAAFHNLTHSNRIGASTISMQVARMMEPKKRTYWNKAREIFAAFQLEWHFSKDEILAMYFNLAPYGGNIEGVKMASKLYFNRNLNELSTAQMALLSVIPKNPNLNRLDKKSNINALKKRVLSELFKSGVIDESAFNRGISENFKNERFDAPNFAPNFAQIAFKSGISGSNLDLELQLEVQNLLKKRISLLRDKKVKNAAAVIIDNDKMEVIAYIGSHSTAAEAGQNDGVLMRRNVGSTLKPFIYALAIENGLITPKSRLIDTQIHLGEYKPKNYYKDFSGIVTASDALGFSLNIPAVKLNHALKENSLYELLKRANLTDEEKKYYGEAIALGSISLNLLELTHLYTIFANSGKLLPLEFGGNFIDSNVSLISANSAFITASMMENATRPYLNSTWKSANKPKIAFKTGTSADNRDLYTIGVSKNYTIGVWMGNFDGSKTDNLTGIDASWNVVFEAFEILAKRGEISPIKKPENLQTKRICTDAFMTKDCKNFDEDFFVSEIKRDCDFYTNEEIFFLLNNQIIALDDLNNSECAQKFVSLKPLIASPAENAEFIAPDNNSSRVKVQCYAIFGEEIWVKIDDGEYQKIKNAQDFQLNLPLGRHKIGCLDENANFSQTEFSVRKF